MSDEWVMKKMSWYMLIRGHPKYFLWLNILNNPGSNKGNAIDVPCSVGSMTVPELRFMNKGLSFGLEFVVMQDLNIRKWLQYYLQDQGFSIQLIYFGTKGLVRVNGNEYEHRCIVSNNHGKHI